MSRAIDLTLEPVDSGNGGANVNVYTYAPSPDVHRTMPEGVYMNLELRRCSFGVELTPDEARVLANQLLQVADVADEHRAARIADDELQASFDRISEEMREHDGHPGVYYAHPDVHYVPAEQMESKARELMAAGVKRFMVLAEPVAEATR